MDPNPFRSIRSYLAVAPTAKWTALVTSVLGPVCLAALFPLLYLFVDLLVHQGRMPAFADLPAGQRQEFRDDWDRSLSAEGTIPGNLARIQAAAGGAKPSDHLVWEQRWQAATHAWLAWQVSPEAAETYLPLDRPADTRLPVRPTPQPLGILSPVARDRGPLGSVLATVARLAPWTWRPAGERSANGLYLTAIFATAFAVALLRGLLANLCAYCASAAAGEAVTRIRRALHTHSYRLTAVAIRLDAQAEAGDLISTRAEQVQDGFQAWLTAGFRGPVLIALLLALMVAVHPWLAASVLLLGGLVWVVAGQVAAWFRQDARLAGRRIESRLALLRESLAVSPLVKGYLMDRFSQTRVERHLSELGRAAWRKNRGDGAARSALLTVGALAGMAMLYLAGLVVLGGGLTAAGLAVLAAALGTLAFAVNRWLTARVRIARARGAAAVILEFLDRRGEAGQPVDAEFLKPLEKRLDLHSVSLREPGTGRMIIENLSLSVPAGSRAALVYADADEAHAVAYLIARFLDPSGGEIKFDGKNIRWVTYESLRTQTCLILEQSLTFSDTAANNIGCGDPGFSLPQVIEAAKKAHAHQFIQAMPYGYETRIGAGGASLRVGERFRIALARAMLRDPSLVVIEEPAEPMDPDSLALIDDAITQLQAGRTLLFLARRPATVKSADLVFVLQNGKLVASGSHDELVTNSEWYRLLHFKQSLTAAESA